MVGEGLVCHEICVASWVVFFLSICEVSSCAMAQAGRLFYVILFYLFSQLSFGRFYGNNCDALETGSQAQLS